MAPDLAQRRRTGLAAIAVFVALGAAGSRWLATAGAALAHPHTRGHLLLCAGSHNVSVSWTEATITVGVALLLVASAAVGLGLLPRRLRPSGLAALLLPLGALWWGAGQIDDHLAANEPASIDVHLGCRHPVVGEVWRAAGVVVGERWLAGC